MEIVEVQFWDNHAVELLQQQNFGNSNYQTPPPTIVSNSLPGTSKKKTIILVILAVLVLLGLVGAGWLYYSRTESSNPTDKEKTGGEESTPEERSQMSTTRKVLVIDFDPFMKSRGGVRTHVALGWNDPEVLEKKFIEEIEDASAGTVNYEIVGHIKVDDIPIKEDGFDYTEETYLSCWNDHSTCHDPDGIDYRKVLEDFQVCDKRNNGEVQELWLWGAPWFGYYESRLAGPDAFWYNSPPLEGTSCKKQLPIMGFNYERGVPEMMESFGHRVESAMSQTFGGWEENRTDHDWDRFGLVKAQSPDYDYSGCGSIHYPPNGTKDYEYDNPQEVLSTCDDFLNYPNLTNVKEIVSCQTWNCAQIGYFRWWFSHFPKASGQKDGLWNNWWLFVLDWGEAVSLADHDN